MLARQKQRGDTLIEVLFAFSVISMVIVGAMAVMNRGVAASQRALETTVVRDEIDAQAETLRYLHGSYVSAFSPFVTNYPTNTAAGQWRLMTNSISATSASPFNTGAVTCPAAPAGSFILDTVNGTYKGNTGAVALAEGIPGVDYGDPNASNYPTFVRSEGVWIEAIRGQSDQENTTFIDFHIRACWNAPGEGPAATTGTIVRLYEPRQ